VLADLDQEVNRALEWLSHDRKAYWAQQVQTGYPRVAEARLTLQRAQLQTVGDRRPTCDLEKKALQRAQHRLQTAEEKTEAVRRWARLLDRELIKFRACINPLSDWLLRDLPRAMAVLKRLMRALDQYVHLEPSAQEAMRAQWNAAMDAQGPPAAETATPETAAPAEPPAAPPTVTENPPQPGVGGPQP
jgi:hypothetical protein